MKQTVIKSSHWLTSAFRWCFPKGLKGLLKQAITHPRTKQDTDQQDYIINAKEEQ